jgi:hypothetical protein
MKTDLNLLVSSLNSHGYYNGAGYSIPNVSNAVVMIQKRFSKFLCFHTGACS